MTRNIEIKYIDPDNKEIKRNFTYANPAASDAVLIAYVQALIALTDNTFVTAKKVDTSVLI